MKEIRRYYDRQGLKQKKNLWLVVHKYTAIILPVDCSS